MTTPLLPGLPPRLTTRPLITDDLEAVYAVYAADEVADSGHLAIEPEDIAGDWARPSFDLATDSIGVLDGDRIVAAAEVTRGGSRAEGAVLPEVRGRGVGSWLTGWTEERAASMGSSRVGQTTPDRSLPQRLLTARGYTVGHTSWVLELPAGRAIPERPLPPDHRLATADTAERVQAACEVIQSAFGEWAGRQPESFEDWAATTVRRPGAQPWQLRVVERSGAVVAAAFTIVDSQGSGFVHQLAVDRAHRGRGLAQALLADAFTGARQHGATRSALSTDSRTGALDLYTKVGMAVTQTWTHLVTDLPRR